MTSDPTADGGLTEQQLFAMLGAGTRDPTVSEIDRLRPQAADPEAFKRAVQRASREFWAEQVRNSPTQQTQLDLP